MACQDYSLPVTVELLNQLEDNNHHKMNIDYIEYEKFNQGTYCKFRLNLNIAQTVFKVCPAKPALFCRRFIMQLLQL